MTLELEKELPELIKLHEESSNVFEDMMHEMGENPLLGRLYALFLFTPNQYFKQGDLADKLNVSVSTISRNLKTLDEWDIINRRLIRKSRERVLSKDKWEYCEKKDSAMSFVQVIKDINIEAFEEKITEKYKTLVRIREHWLKSSDQCKKSKEGRNIIEVLNILINYFKIVEEEYKEFLDRINGRLKNFDSM